MDAAELERIELLVSEFVLDAGDQALQAWETLKVDVHADGADVTTNTDRKIEKEFAEFVSKNFPEHGFQGEEFPELNRSGEYVWMIDPIDGTKFYALQVPLWGVTVALVRNNEPILGIIYNPVAKQLYHAHKGGGAFLNGRKISVKQETDLKKLQVSLDVALNADEYFARKEKLSPLLEKLTTSVYRVRMPGNGSFSLAWLAQGFFGAFVNPYRPAAKLVDVSGGLIIALEAGAEVYKQEIAGEPGLYNILVAHPEVIKQLLPLFDSLN